MTSTEVRPPGPKGRWLVGNTLDYDRDRMGFLRAGHERYGDVFSFDERTIVVRDPDLVHELLIRTNDDFSSASSAVATRFEARTDAETARAWMTARRAGWRGLNRATVIAHTARLRALFERTLDDTGGRAVDVMPLMETYSGRAAADFCLGPDADGIAEVVAENTAAIEPLSGSSQLFPEWFPSRAIRRFRRARDATLDAITTRIHRRRTPHPPDQPRDLLDVLLAAREPEMRELQVQRLIRGILLAAYGVPAASMTWTIHTLVTHPDLWDRVAAESSAWDGDDEPPLSALPQTEAVIREVLRLWPPTWLMGRTAVRPTTLGDWRLSTRDAAMFSPFLLHRDPRWWPDPDRADPDRWLRGETPRKHAYLPFGAGPRVCVGTQLGMIQLTLGAFWLTRNYRVAAPDAAACAPEFHNLLVPQGFRASFTRV
ncbi:cytochrome P450 [Saccharothrix violaceirubra]|uniref:Unspecific monooxygenase n=1 Tax=Saccharothrix violaceirubra TaxID=413306 RepID=A0A7W7WVP5_9PSEU|nr:cytochrome P450 [Saccharothrix violaceirubra]MBB4965117.1 unspecific monooxygenase [Saccharothrix violaceirubra]